MLDYPSSAKTRFGNRMRPEAEVVATNLVHQQLWRDVKTLDVPLFSFCEGIPPKKLHPDDDQPFREYVLATQTEDSWTVQRWAQAFAALKSGLGLAQEPRRIVHSMITNDSTVVYYIVYNGLQVPRKN